jgi:predicted DNA-binding transcriptional regulator YafY
VVFKKKYYKYQLPEMALDNIHLSDTDIDALQNLMPFEPYLRIFDLMDDALNLLKKIEELKKKKMQLKPVIDFDFSQKTTDGLQWLPLLYKAIFEKQCIDVPYNPFSREKKEGHGYKKGFSPWRLKQNRHRWYVMGWCEGRFDIMGLERMQEILPSLSRYVPEKSGYIDSYFKNLIGITKPDDDTKQVDVVSLRFTGSSMQYIRSKMLHWSMRIDSDTETELVVSMDLQINYELVSLILSYGEMVEVLAPEILREKIRVRLRKLSVFYGL